MNPLFLRKIQTFCAYQERSQKAVRTKLIAIGARGLELENIIVYLIQENFLNEERFARLYAGSKFRIKKWGRNRIRQELKMQSISDICIRKALAEIPESDYIKVLYQLAEKKFEQLSQLRLQKNLQQKLYNYLAAKGFESALVSNIVRKYYG